MPTGSTPSHLRTTPDTFRTGWRLIAVGSRRRQLDRRLARSERPSRRRRRRGTPLRVHSNAATVTLVAARGPARRRRRRREPDRQRHRRAQPRTRSDRAAADERCSPMSTSSCPNQTELATLAGHGGPVDRDHRRRTRGEPGPEPLGDRHPRRRRRARRATTAISHPRSRPDRHPGRHDCGRRLLLRCAGRCDRARPRSRQRDPMGSSCRRGDDPTAPAPNRRCRPRTRSTRSWATDPSRAVLRRRSIRPHGADPRC